METLVTVTARLVEAAIAAYGKKWSFFLLFLLSFVGTVVVLGQLDLLPNPPRAAVAVTEPLIGTGTTTTAVAEIPRAPEKIEIAKINLSVTISNPTTTNVEALDHELLSGAVRYPTSAKLGEDGNVVLFGHSSYLPIVKNKAYKTFNDIQKLVAGDTITVYAGDTAYVYKVRTMEKESASTAGISLAVTGRVLTLATCDSFGAKTDRFVVTADFVESHSVASK